MPPNPATFNDDSPDQVRAASLLQWLIKFLFSFQAKYYIPDSAIDGLFHFLYVFFSVLARFSPFLSFVAKICPKSRYMAQRYVGVESSFTKFVLCPKCFKLHSFENAKEKVGSQETSKRCDFVQYPNHPHLSRRGPCNTVLLKSVEVLSGRSFLHPHKIYCYKSLTSTLQEFLLHPGFIQECEHWRTRDYSTVLRDIYVTVYAKTRHL